MDELVHKIWSFQCKNKSPYLVRNHAPILISCVFSELAWIKTDQRVMSHFCNTSTNLSQQPLYKSYK